jgi:hypothetical protein
MYAIEFRATIKNGMIPIPQQYLAQLQPPLKVIVLQEESVVKKDVLKQKDEFLARVAQHRFDLPQDYRFKREELYDRI